VIDGICSYINLINIVLSDDHGIVSLEIHNAVLVHMVTDFVSSVINLIEFDKISLIISMN
jgi:hypothetical protein